MLVFGIPPNFFHSHHIFNAILWMSDVWCESIWLTLKKYDMYQIGFYVWISLLRFWNGFFLGNGAEVGCDLRKAIWGSWKDDLNCKLELNLAWKHYLSAKKIFFIYFYGFNQRTPLVKSKNYCKNASTLYKTPETDLLLDISTSKHRKILHRCLKNRCSSTYPHLLHINQLSECYACKHKFTITTKKKQKLHNFWLNGIFHAENFFINFSTFSIWFLYNFISIWKISHSPCTLVYRLVTSVA